jgi:hypothetical protein
MGKPAIYNLPSTVLPPIKSNPREEERYRRIHKAPPKSPTKKTK